MSKIAGGCLCGNVHYSSDAEPVMVAACHCTHCRKQSGTAYSMNIGVPAASVKLSGDTLKTYADTGTSGLKVLRKFCGDCGSPIASDIEAFPGLLFLKAGTLDDPSVGQARRRNLVRLETVRGHPSGVIYPPSRGTRLRARSTLIEYVQVGLAERNPTFAVSASDPLKLPTRPTAMDSKR